MSAERLRPGLDAEARLTREVAELERRIDEVQDLRTVYHDHLLRLLEWRLGQRRQALERLRCGEGTLALAGLDPRALR
jgi:hypothetical protein